MTVLHDLRFALRLLWKDRWFTAAAAAALALGIGVNTTVFTFVNAVLLRGLPFPDSGRIVFVSSRQVERDDDRLSTSWRDLEDWRQSATAFEGLEGWMDGTMNISESGRLPERVRGSFVTAGTFRLLGQPPLIGRDFAPEASAEGAAPVVILGYRVWQDRYSGDPAVIGRVIKVNEVPATVVGVMPEGMKFPTNAAMWQAWQPKPADAKRDWRDLSVFGRLRQASSMAQAQSQLTTITARLAQQHPESNKGIDAYVLSFNDRFNGGRIKLLFLTLMGAVGFVLLIACANVANLLLARSVHRSREVAVRVALGAGRARIVRQLLVESVLLSLLGGVVGLGLALAGVRAFDVAVAGVGKPYWIVFSLDWTVFGYLAAVSIATGLLFGVAPAFQVSKTNVNEVLKEGGRGQTGGLRARRLTSTMVVVQLALTLVLLSGAGLMVRSFFTLYNLEFGVDGAHLILMQVSLAERKDPTPDSRRQFYDRLAIELGRVPGALAATLGSDAPGGGAVTRTLEVDGRALPAGAQRPHVATVLVGDSYFETMGVRLRRGRAFGPRDGLTGNETVIVNERFASRFFPREDPIGRRVRFSAENDTMGPWLTVVGISPEIRQGDIRDAEPPSVAYFPQRMDPWKYTVIMARSGGDPTSLTAPLRRAVQTVDADMPVFNVQTFTTFVGEMQWPYRVFGSLFAIFALIALTLSSIGIYAVMAYSVAQRRHEIGVRMALGASAADVVRGVLRTAAVQLGVGLALGMAGAWGAGRLLKSLLVQGNGHDGLTYALVIGVLVVVTLAACVVPARRAAKVDPLVALRSE